MERLDKSDVPWGWFRCGEGETKGRWKISTNDWIEAKWSHKAQGSHKAHYKDMGLELEIFVLNGLISFEMWVCYKSSLQPILPLQKRSLGLRLVYPLTSNIDAQKFWFGNVVCFKHGLFGYLSICVKQIGWYFMSSCLYFNLTNYSNLIFWYGC